MNKNICITRAGVFVRTSSPLLTGWEKPESLQKLSAYSDGFDMTPEVGMNYIGPKIPKKILEDILGTIHEFPKIETGYMLWYKPTSKEWMATCPEQRGTGAFCAWDTGAPPAAGFSAAGTLHVHPEMGAFWSGTDMADQKGKYGIHVVVGTKGGLADTWKCTVFTPYGSYDKQLFDIFEETKLKEVYKPVEEWCKTIREAAYVEPKQTYAPLPAGTYSIRPTKAPYDFSQYTTIASTFPHKENNCLKSVIEAFIEELAEADPDTLLDALEGAGIVALNLNELSAKVRASQLSLILESASDPTTGEMEQEIMDVVTQFVYGIEGSTESSGYAPDLFGDLT